MGKMSTYEKEQLNKILVERYDKNSLIRQMVDFDALYEDIMNAAEAKRDSYHVLREIGTDYTDIKHKPDNKLYKKIVDIRHMILTKNIPIINHTKFIISDGLDGKERQIIKPDFGTEQIIHHALVRVLLPTFTKGLYKYSCASIPGRGIHYAKKHIEKLIRKQSKHTKYYLKIDIKKFFDSIPHKPLKEMLIKKVHDKDVRDILFKVINTTDVGLPIGFYTSQWLSNLYLESLDHYISEHIVEDIERDNPRKSKRSKKRKRDKCGMKHYFRYMDDMVIFSSNKRKLKKVREYINKYLEEKLGLKMKDNWTIVRFSTKPTKKNKKKYGEFLDFVGFKFYYNETKIRKRIYKKIKALIKELKARGKDNISVHQARSMLSYYGFIKWSDAKGLYIKELKPWVSLKDLKKIVKDEDKRRSKAKMKNNSYSLS